MRLINGDKIIRNLKKWSNPTVADRNNWCIQIIEGEETVKAIPLDKVKQAREEIKNSSIEVYTDYEEYDMVETADALKILDELIKESEG